MGTLGSGNHYLEVQAVVEIFDAETVKSLYLKAVPGRFESKGFTRRQG
jgi:RNA-splicing ligase RtcB